LLAWYRTRVIRVLLCDDHAIVRAGLRVLLEREPDFTIVGEASDGHEAVRMTQHYQPAVVLLDLAMPGGSGLNAIVRIREETPQSRILVLSMHAAPEYVRPALRAGASGYVVKGSGLSDLLVALRTIAAGGRFLGSGAQHLESVDQLQLAAKEDDLQRLTQREREVLQLVAEGQTNRQIGVKLGLSPKTVDTHRTSLMRKLDLHDVQAVTRFAVRRGLISPE
jgi:two-component system response regulator NreC